MYIRSKLGHDLVMDVAGANTTPGTPIQSFPRNCTDAQLWRKERLPDGRFYLVSKLGDCVKLQIQVWLLHVMFCNISTVAYIVLLNYVL